MSDDPRRAHEHANTGHRCFTVWDSRNITHRCLDCPWRHTTRRDGTK